MSLLSAHNIIEGKVDKTLRHWLGQQHYSMVFILVDEQTKKHCLDLLPRIELLANAEIIEIQSGEDQKNLSTCQFIWDSLLDLKADRMALFVNLGGGVIGDLGGFASATFKRGIDFIHIPTTLLAQVDASAGGKTGINFREVKNAIGVFKDPVAVFLDHAFLDTLPERHLWNGFAEMIKHALISDRNLWERTKIALDKRQPDLSALIAASLLVKLKIVEHDPQEKGQRKILNFGHTIGHAIEALMLSKGKNQVLHGEAVIAGIICALHLSVKYLGFSDTECAAVTQVLKEKYPKVNLHESDFQQLTAFMENDKKNKKGTFRFVLLAEIGKPTIDVACSTKDVHESLKFYRQLHDL